ncbi:MAG: NAD-dependent epimerase/dehydratase family protein, partial [Phycisphaerales bacterium]
MEPQQPQGTIVIARGSGFLGTSLAHHLAEGGCKVIVLSRTPRTDKQASSLTHSIIEWDARSLGAWADCLNGASGIVNLVGRSVDCIKSPDHCDEILRSRVEATTVLGAAVRAVDQPPPVWLQMSTAHIYGDPPDVICDEDAAFGYGLAPLVGQAWEDACAKAVLPDMRTVILRTSFVIGRGGGALARLGRLARLGLGGTIGHGRQGMSWIHIHDMNRIFDRALTDQSIQGAYIA